MYGTLKTFAGRISATAFAIKPVTDHNEGRRVGEGTYVLRSG